MNRQCQVSDMQIIKCKNITIKQPLNWTRLIQVGNIQGCFVDLKLYFSLSKLFIRKTVSFEILFSFETQVSVYLAK